MASAWAQVEAIERTNQALRQAQLARSASGALYRASFKQMDPATLLVTTINAHSRIRGTGELTVGAEARSSVVPDGALSAGFRRAARPHGPVARRAGWKSGSWAADAVRRLNDGSVKPVPDVKPPSGMVTTDQVLDEISKVSGIGIPPGERFCAVTPERVEDALYVAITSAALYNQILKDLNDALNKLKWWEKAAWIAKWQVLIEAIKTAFEALRKYLTDIQKDHVNSARQALERSRDALLKIPPNFPNVAAAECVALVEYAIAYKLGPPADNQGKIAWDVAFLVALTKFVDFLGLLNGQSLDSFLSSLAGSNDRLNVDIIRGSRNHQRRMPECDLPAEPQKPPLSLEAIKDVLAEKLNPENTIPVQLAKRVDTPPGWNPDDPLEPVMTAPTFPVPMFKPLAELSQEFILPGLNEVPPNTVTLLRTNPRFVEAYMVGLNHEMSRELLWREFPTDQRGTYFRRFWDHRGRMAAATSSEDLDDISSIVGWKSGLGAHLKGADSTGSPAGDGGELVLLIRGDLLRRFPRALIYAAEAEWRKEKVKDPKTGVETEQYVRRPKALPPGIPNPADPGLPEKYPSFWGSLPPDTAFIGFPLSVHTARGSTDPSKNNPGYFIVLQEPPTEPQFGLDEDKSAPESIGSWSELGWGAFGETDAKAGYLNAAQFPRRKDNTDISGALPVQPAGATKLAWGQSSAASAAITMQPPFRIAIHADDMLP